MGEYTIEMTADQVEDIMQKELMSLYITCSKDLELRKQGRGIAVYVQDPNEDCIAISEMISALETVMDYYGVN